MNTLRTGICTSTFLCLYRHKKSHSRPTNRQYTIHEYSALSVNQIKLNYTNVTFLWWPWQFLATVLEEFQFLVPYKIKSVINQTNITQRNVTFSLFTFQYRYRYPVVSPDKNINRVYTLNNEELDIHKQWGGDFSACRMSSYIYPTAFVRSEMQQT
jgi:hypothetical protein